MVEVVLFHHALGLTPGVVAFADDLRAAGHTVHVPECYEGRTFATVEDGVAHAKEIGFSTVVERGRAAAEQYPAEVVYAGMSLGAMTAETLAMERPGARGALIMHSAILPSDLDGTWPAGVPIQIHTMADDAWGDADIAAQIPGEIPDAEVFIYPGDRHLFTDRSALDEYDPEPAALVLERSLAFLAALN
jgi:dienelactone hydrolase